MSGSYDAPNISETVLLIAVKYGKGAGAPALNDPPEEDIEVHPLHVLAAARSAHPR